MSEFKYIKIQSYDAVALITIDRPPVNALNREVFSEIKEAFTKLSSDRDVRAVVITGGGKKAFVAGADINEFIELSKVGRVKEMSTNGQDVFNYIEQTDFPVIAAISGFCFGAGNELAMACDLRIASESSKFGQPEINLGLIPGAAGTQRLPRLVGKAVAKRMIYLGDPISAAEAYRVGLVNEVVPDDQVLEYSLSLAKKLAAKAPVALGYCKRCINEGVEVSLAEGQDLESDYFDKVFKTEDVFEGINAFFEKRNPIFKGE